MIKITVRSIFSRPQDHNWIFRLVHFDLSIFVLSHGDGPHTANRLIIPFECEVARGYFGRLIVSK